MNDIAALLRTHGLDVTASIWERPGHRNYAHQTALHYLALDDPARLGDDPEQTRAQLFEAMLATGLDPNIRGISKGRTDTALGLAIRYGRPKASLLPLIEAQSVWADELAVALTANNADACELLLARDDLLISEYGFPMLCAHGERSDVERALKLGARVDQGVSHTPLVMAVIYDRRDIVDLLLETANVDHPGLLGPPIFWVRNIAMLDHLVERGATLDARFNGQDLVTSVSWRAKLDEEWETLVRALVQRGLDMTPALDRLYDLIAKKKTKLQAKELGGDANRMRMGGTVASRLMPRQCSGAKGVLGTKADKTKPHFERLVKLVSKKTAKLRPDRPEWLASAKLLTFPAHAGDLESLRERVDDALEEHLGDGDVEDAIREHATSDALRVLALLWAAGPTVRDSTGRNALTFLLDPPTKDMTASLRKLRAKRTRLATLMRDAGCPLLPSYDTAAELSSVTFMNRFADAAWVLDADYIFLTSWFTKTPERVLRDVHMGTRSALLAASGANWAEGIRASIAAGATLATPTLVGPAERPTPLEYAVRNDALDALEILLSAGADPNAITASGPVLATCPSDAVLDLLLERGALLEAYNSDGETALASLMPHAHGKDRQSPHQHRDRVAALLDRGADPNCRDTVGACPLHRAVVRSGDIGLQLTRMLLEAGADPNAATVQGLTPAHYAARLQDPSAIIDALERGGADFHRTAKDGKSAIQALVDAGHSSLARQLAFADAADALKTNLSFATLSAIHSRGGSVHLRGESEWTLELPGRFAQHSGDVVTFQGTSGLYENIAEVPNAKLSQIAYCDDLQYSICIIEGDPSDDPKVYEIDHEGWFRGEHGPLSRYLSRLKTR